MTSQSTQKKAQQQRDDLTGEHAAGDAGQIMLACLFAAIWIADTFYLKYTTFLNGYIHLVARILAGVALFVIAGYVARTGLSIVFGEIREKSCVIKEGVFGVVRHPIYLSEILLYLGFLMLSMSLAAAVVWLCAIGFLYYISRFEEKLLLVRFGEEYEQYMRDVPMWVPRIRKR